VARGYLIGEYRSKAVFLKLLLISLKMTSLKFLIHIFLLLLPFQPLLKEKFSLHFHFSLSVPTQLVIFNLLARALPRYK
jgi:hypothetical protein